METQIWQTYKDRDVVVFGINVDEPQSVVEDFINEFQITYPVLMATRALQNQYELANNAVAPYPRDFIIGRDGLFAYVSDEYDPEAMIEVIESELLSTSVEDGRNTPAPKDISLVAIYPNPAVGASGLSGGGKVSIVYRLNKTSEVTVQIFDIRGRLVRTLVQGRRNPGEYTIYWDGQTQKNISAAVGTYFVRLHAGNAQQIKKITLIR